MHLFQTGIEENICAGQKSLKNGKKSTYCQNYIYISKFSDWKKNLAL